MFFPTYYKALCLTTTPVRNYVTSKVMVISGGTSKMTPEIVRQALERNYKIFCCTRSAPSKEVFGVIWEKIDDHSLANVSHWNNIFSKVSTGKDEVYFVNTIGTAIVPKGKSLEDVNEKPVLAALEAFKTLKCKKKIGQISSIAATYIPEDEKLLKHWDVDGIKYSLGRKKVDLILKDSGIPTTILRPGFVFNDFRAGKMINTGHDYSPEQFTELLVHPIIGSGKQKHQPVYLGNLIEALLNGLETDQTHLINAVGPETLTQEEMIKFFLLLKGNRPFKPVKIPDEVAKVIAKYCPKGRLAPYSVALLQHLDREEPELLCKQQFQNLVRSPLKTLKEVYQVSENEVNFPSSPVLEHIKEMIVEIAKSPEARRAFFKISKKYGPSLVLNSLSAYFKLNS